MTDNIAGVENDGLEFGGLRNEGLKILQFCKCQSPITDRRFTLNLIPNTWCVYIVLLCVTSSSLVIVMPFVHCIISIIVHQIPVYHFPVLQFPAPPPFFGCLSFSSPANSSQPTSIFVWLLVKILRLTPHKIRHFRDVQPISWLDMEKQNLTQEKHTFTNQKKCTTAQNKQKNQSQV